MEILSYLDLFLGAFLNVLFAIIIVRRVFKIKTIENKKKKYFAIIILTIFVGIINIINKNAFKALLVMPLYAICVNAVFNVKVSKSIYYTLISSFYLLIGDLIISLILSILNIDYTFLSTNILGKSIGNILVIISVYPLLYINSISTIFVKLQTYKIKTKNIFILFTFFLMIGSAFVFKSTSNIESLISIIRNLILFSVFIILIVISYNETRKVNKVSDEYNALLNYLDRYECELDEKRKLIHDFRNQLIIINSYIDDKVKLKEYLNGIIEEQKSIKESKIVKNINKLPKGLKGLFYYKLSQINEDICISLNVKIKSQFFEKLSPKDNKNILKIIGILIDNAIESSIDTEDKYLIIDIEINKNNFKLNIINSYLNNFENSKIMDLRFSTKGKNRGYGLSLIKDIIVEDKRYSLNLIPNEKDFITEFEMYIK